MEPLFPLVVAVIPLQLLAYQIAVLRGCDVEKARNLAKSHSGPYRFPLIQLWSGKQAEESMRSSVRDNNAASIEWSTRQGLPESAGSKVVLKLDRVIVSGDGRVGEQEPLTRARVLCCGSDVQADGAERSALTGVHTVEALGGRVGDNHTSGIMWSTRKRSPSGGVVQAVAVFHGVIVTRTRSRCCPGPPLPPRGMSCKRTEQAWETTRRSAVAVL